MNTRAELGVQSYTIVIIVIIVVIVIIVRIELEIIVIIVVIVILVMIVILVRATQVRAYDDMAKGSFVRSSYVLTLHPVAKCPYLCTFEA